MSPDPITVATNVFRVLARGDADLAQATAAPDFRNREATAGPTACSTPGPAGLLASSAWMRSAFTDLQFPIIDSAAHDDRVWLRLRMQGTHTGPFVRFDDGRPAQVIPPTGREIDFEQIHVLTVRDHLVHDHEAVRDDITMLEQLRVLPPPPALGLRLAVWKLTGRATRAASTANSAAQTAAASAHPVQAP